MYNWKTKGPNAIEVFATELAQYDLLDVVTSKKASTNSKGKDYSMQLCKVDLNVSGNAQDFLIHWTYKHEKYGYKREFVYVYVDPDPPNKEHTLKVEVSHNTSILRYCQCLKHKPIHKQLCPSK